MKSIGIIDEYNSREHFILTRPAKISDIIRSDLPYDNDDFWKEKARLLQVRRWRKIKNQEEN